MQWLCERRKKERWGETGLERGGCFYSMIHPFMIQKKWGATVFLCGKMEKTKKRKGINLPCDASSHIWLPNLRSVMFYFAVAPVPVSSQLQHFTAISSHVVKKSFFFFPAPPRDCAAMLSVTGVNNWILHSDTASHAWVSGTILDSISCEQNKFNHNSRPHACAECSPCWIPLALWDFHPR